MMTNKFTDVNSVSEEKMRAAFRKLFKYEMSDDYGSETFARGYQAALKFADTNSESEAGAATAKHKYDECMLGNQELSAIERLRFFCSLAMNGQDWLDVESFFDDLAAHPSAQAIETAAIMKCVEVCDEVVTLVSSKDHRDACKGIRNRILTLLPQDGRTQLEEFGMNLAEEVGIAVAREGWGIGWPPAKLRAIVTNLIGDAK